MPSPLIVLFAILSSLMLSGCYYQMAPENPYILHEHEVEKLKIEAAAHCDVTRDDLVKIEIDVLVRPNGFISWIGANGPKQQLVDCIAHHLYGKSVITDGSIAVATQH